MRLRRSSFALMLLGFCLAEPAFAGPAVATKWLTMRLSLEDCRTRAEAAIHKREFGRIERSGQSVIGQRGEYTAAIRCVPEKQMAFFVVSGPSRDRSVGYLDEIYDAY